LGKKAMHTYKTKVINLSGEVISQVSADHRDDFAAIRAARKLCGLGEIAQVWRERLCIYSERPMPIRLVRPPVSGEKSA